MKLALISCGKYKRAGCHMAKDLYISNRFRLAWDYAKRTHDAVLILSAKHGLLDPYRFIRSYDTKLNDISHANREKWAQKVAREICDYSPDDAEVTFLAGKMYTEFVVDLLGKRQVATPLKGLRQGEQLQWLKNKI